jgi:hypothetical protein
MNEMKNAPRDGTEILAFHIPGNNFHPVIWKSDHWGMRWNLAYHTTDDFYSGWIPYPSAAQHRVHRTGLIAPSHAMACAKNDGSENCDCGVESPRRFCLDLIHYRAGWLILAALAGKTNR